MRRCYSLLSMAKKHFGESNGKILRFPSHVMIMFRLFVHTPSMHGQEEREQGHGRGRVSGWKRAIGFVIFRPTSFSRSQGNTSCQERIPDSESRTVLESPHRTCTPGAPSHAHAIYWQLALHSLPDLWYYFNSRTSEI